VNCYRTNCKCDDIKKMYCLFKLSKEQQRLMKKIRKNNYCDECGSTTVKAKYKNKYINLCTECGVRRKVA
jgi:ribosomal protein L37AE/L43A